MKAKPDCIVCMFKQALNTTRAVTDDAEVQRRVLTLLARKLGDPKLDRTPAALSQPAYEAVSEVTGVADPYAEAKRESNRVALALLPEFRDVVARSADPLRCALHVAVAGNVIDLGIGHTVDIEADIRQLLRQPFAIDASAELAAELAPGRRLLYLGDNAGEIVFDTLLVRELQRTGARVTYTVKSGPIINDATMADAREVGMSDLVPIVETGSNDIGVHWDHVSEPFRRAFQQADLVLGKGHGNFETCRGRSGNFYFLLKAKCPVVAEELGVKLGDIVLAHDVRRSREVERH